MEGLNPVKYYVKRQVCRLPPQHCAVIYSLLSFLPSLTLRLSVGDLETLSSPVI